MQNSALTALLSEEFRQIGSLRNAQPQERTLQKDRGRKITAHQSKRKPISALSYTSQFAAGLSQRKYNALGILAPRHSATAALHALMKRFCTGQKENALNKFLF